MIFYTITDSMPVKPDWGSISGSLKAGTPISVKGAISNDDGAVGLVAADTAHGAEAVLVVTAGVVDLAEASASYGSAISDDVVKALDNVAFIYGGKVYGVAESSLPAVTAEDNGDVLTVVDGAWAKAAGGGGAFGFPCYVAKFVPNEDVTVGEDHYKGYDITFYRYDGSLGKAVATSDVCYQLIGPDEYEAAFASVSMIGEIENPADYQVPNAWITSAPKGIFNSDLMVVIDQFSDAPTFGLFIS